MTITIGLWAINKWLRWTGWRIIVSTGNPEPTPTRVGIKFYGWTGWNS